MLTARFVTSASKPGRYADGDGLYLIVRQRGDDRDDEGGKKVERLWLFRYSRGQRGEAKERTLSLGPARNVPLAAARKIAGRCRELLAAGGDPRDALKRSEAPSFGELADDHVAHLGLNPKTTSHWKLTLGDTYCRPIRSKSVDQLTTEDLVALLKPLWHTKPETAQRLRTRIEKVMDGAKVRGLFRGENPARWRGHLEHLLAPPKVLTRGHHKALPWQEIPAFMARLRKLESVSALALEWTILTCARTIETTGAVKGEVDSAQRLWIVPPERMKAKREHRVPLTDRCLAIFEEAEELKGAFLFPGTTNEDPLSYMAMLQCLKGLVPGITVHGFRSSFRDWVGEATTYPDHLAEAALAHIVGDKTERAYRRGDALERRRAMMVDWEKYCAGKTGTMSDNVIDFREPSSRRTSAR